MKYMDEAPPGWRPLVERLLERLSHVPGWDPSRILQIKSKFGGLRFYYTPHDEEVEKLVLEAEKEASRTCERCGVGGTLRERPTGWLVTECDACFAKAGR